MKKIRIIPVLLLKNGLLVQSRNFKYHENIGNPSFAVQRFSEWMTDEIVYLDISRDKKYNYYRDDINYRKQKNFKQIIKDVSKVTFMPLTLGGKVRTLKHIEDYLKMGADKVSINTAVLNNINFLNEAAKEFGSQSIVISMDVKKIKNKYKVMKSFGSEETVYEAHKWSKIVSENGAGEILLNSIDRDGTKKGYDIKLINNVYDSSTVPLIPIGGAGKLNHFSNLLSKTKVDTVSAANYFHHKDQSDYLLKKYLFEKDFNVRKPEFKLWKPNK